MSRKYHNVAHSNACGGSEVPYLIPVGEWHGSNPHAYVSLAHKCAHISSQLRMTQYGLSELLVPQRLKLMRQDAIRHSNNAVARGDQHH